MGAHFSSPIEAGDMTEKVVVVTGATYVSSLFLVSSPVIDHLSSGIGFGLARYFYSRGAKVYLAARNETKARDCMKKLEAEKPRNPGQLLFLRLDLDDPQGVLASGQELLRREDKLDVLGELGASQFYTISSASVLQHS